MSIAGALNSAEEFPRSLTVIVLTILQTSHALSQMGPEPVALVEM